MHLLGGPKPQAPSSNAGLFLRSRLVSVFDPLRTLATCSSMTVMKLITLAVAAIGLLTPEARASAKQPIKLEGMEYLKARRVILGYGWSPWVGHCEADPKTCAAFPEVDVCSASFPVQCGMRFVRGTSCLMVGTTGEAPPGFEAGEPHIEGVHFRRRTCKEIFREPKP